MKLTLLVGPPGSGKTTYARVLQNGFYINQDLQGKEHLKLFHSALLTGDDVVVDRMNFSKEQRDRYLKPAKELGYETEIVVFHESFNTCFNRCLERKDHPTIVDEKGARSALQTFFTKYERVQDNEADSVVRKYSNPENRVLAVISDLDGTLCNIDHRLEFIKADKKDWKNFFYNINGDSVNWWCADILNKMSDQYKIVYCSGRPDDHQKVTIDWLQKYDLFNSRDLYMRKRGDFRADDIVKEVILDFEILTRYEPWFIIDDRKRVVDMWRRRGYTVLQCAPGDF